MSRTRRLMDLETHQVVFTSQCLLTGAVRTKAADRRLSGCGPRRSGQCSASSILSCGTSGRALPPRDVAAAIETVRASGASPAARLAFEFLVLKAARSGEVRGARWAEMDTDAYVWTVPVVRMRMTREHWVPLSGRAVEILDAARPLGDGGRLVFPGGGETIAKTSLPRLLQQHGIAAVPHGFRSSFRDWAGEETNHPREVIEAALAHAVGNKVEAAYARSDLFERRRRLMDDWAAYLAGERRPADSSPR